MTESTRAKNALMSCPFCGSEAYVEQERHGRKHYVGCKKSSCLGFSGLGWMYETEKEAIEAWNARAERTCKNLNCRKDAFFFCSECGFNSVVRHNNKEALIPRFCPNCGARVIGGEE